MRVLQVSFLINLLLLQNKVVAVGEDPCKAPSFELTNVKADFGSAEAFYDIAQGMTKGMQANMDDEFYQKISDLLNGKQGDSQIADHVFYIIRKEVGVVIFLIIGAIFVVGLPVSGLIFCCCRYAGNCGAGGKNPRKERTCSKVSLPVYLFFLVVAIIFILVGMIIYGVGVQNTNDNIDLVSAKADGIIGDIRKTLMSAAGDVSCHGSRTVDSLFSNIGNTVRGVPNQTFEKFKVFYGYYSMESIVNERDDLNNASSRAINATDRALDSVNALNGTDQDSRDSLDRLKNQLNGTNILLNVLSQNIDNVYQELEPVYQDVQQRLADALAEVERTVNSSSEALNTAHDGITRLLRDLNKTVTDIDSKIEQFNNDIKKIENDIMTYSGRDSVVQGAKALVLVPCALVIFPAAVVAIFGLLRVIQNVFCLSFLSCFTSIGGYIAVFGITCAFVLGWIVMLVASIAFVGGFSVETVCLGLFRDKDLKLFNYLDIFSFDIPNQYTGETINIQFGEVLRNCEHGSSIFSALNGGTIMNETAILGQANLDQYRNDAINQLTQHSLNYTFSGNETAALNATYSQVLSAFAEIDFQLTNVNATGGDLNKTKEDLSEANATTSRILDLIGKLILDLDDVIKGANKSSTFVEDGSGIINGTFYTTMGDIETNIRSAKEELLEDTYNCKPVYDIWQNVGVMTCDTVGRPVQGMWAAAGLAAIFLILAIAMLAIISGILYQRHSSKHHY